jgi:cysteine desulfurase
MTHHFDGNATMPIYQEALDAFVEFSHHHWVNSSALYRRASAAQEQLTLARHQIAEILNLDPKRIIFTANASVTHSLLFSTLTQKLPTHSAVLSSPLEHVSVRLPFTQIFNNHPQYSIDPQSNLQLDINALEQTLKNNQISFLSLMTAHNESGIVNPTDEIQASVKLNLNLKQTG